MINFNKAARCLQEAARPVARGYRRKIRKSAGQTMNQQEAIIQLNKWENDELLFKDYGRVQSGDFPLDAFLKKWENEPVSLEYAINPKTMATYLQETSYIPDKYDITIVKSPRYLPLFWHRHEFYEIVYVLCGKSNIIFDRTALELTSGDFLMIAPNYSHQIGVFDDDSIVLNIIIRSSTLLDIFLNAIRDKTLISRFLLSHTYGGKMFSYLLFHARNDFTIRNYILDIYIELDKPDDYSNRIATSLVTILFTQLVRHYSGTADMPDMHRSDNVYASQVMNYILDHYADCTLEGLAHHLHFSAQYCSKIIKSSTGLSFSELLTNIRIQKAKNLLLSTPMKINDISDHLGYSNPETFIRVFKKNTGTTPSAYRKSYS